MIIIATTLIIITLIIVTTQLIISATTKLAAIADTRRNYNENDPNTNHYSISLTTPADDIPYLFTYLPSRCINSFASLDKAEKK